MTKINDQIWSQDIQTKNDHITIGHLFGHFQLSLNDNENNYKFDNEFVHFTKF